MSAFPLVAGAARVTGLVVVTLSFPSYQQYSPITRSKIYYVLES
jgi:hypothetical protein